MAEFKLSKAHQIDPNSLAPKASFEDIPSDFIPFSGYYNKDTVITKNGELMKVIRITGFNHENVSSEIINLRDTIRESISKNIKTDNFAIWISTIRRKKNIAPGGEFVDFFSEELNKAWNLKHKWHHKYVNELYISITIEAKDISIVNPISLLKSFSLNSTKNLHKKELKKSCHELDKIVNKILEDLNEYGARILSIINWQGEIYSEHLRFLGKIVNLNEDRYPVNPSDMSEELVANYKFAIGNNSLAVSGNGVSNFAAMFSVKEYQEISLLALDKFLQLPQEFIVTQSIDFIDRNQALTELDYQNYILDVSRNPHLKELSGLEHIISGDKGSVTDYGKQQITLMLINPTTHGLSKDIENSLEKLHELGLVTVREDIFSESCYWSQLPGNFSFLRRQKPINIGRIGGFASLHNFPAGNRDGNYWGHAVTIFRTVVGTPYFFNFHDGRVGHTMIVGPLGSGKTALLNFLIAQSRKFNNKVYYFCHNNSSKIFLNAIEGVYFSLSKDLNHSESLIMSPLCLKRKEANDSFLRSWFKYLVTYGKEKIPKNELDLMDDIVNQILDKNIKTIKEAAKFFKNKKTENIYKKLAPWHSSGKYAFLFDHDAPINFDKNLINAFDLTSILNKKPVLIAVVSYLLHKIEANLDGSPAIIVLDQAWDLLDNYAIGPNIKKLLNRLKEKNCIVIFATESVEKIANSNITGTIYENIATQIFLPEANPTDYYKTVFGLNNEEFELLSEMSLKERHFLLKCSGDSVVASLDLSYASHLLAVLSANQETLFAMDELKKEFGIKAKDWVPEFLNLIKNLSSS